MRRTIVGLACVAICAGLIQTALAEPANPAAPLDPNAHVSIDPDAQIAPPPQVKSKLKRSCTTEQPMGSHIRQKTCRGQGQLDREREESRHFMEVITSKASYGKGG
jgi:hypothetical protein